MGFETDIATKRVYHSIKLKLQAKLVTKAK